MSNTNGPSALKEQLICFEQDIEESIIAELIRIGRPVEKTEFSSDPLHLGGLSFWDVTLSETLDVIFRQIPNDVPHYLADLFLENKVLHWDMIFLVESLMEIQPDSAEE